MATRIPALLLSKRRVLLTILTASLAVLISPLFLGNASAQIAPPKPGVELPQSYLQKVAEDKTAFQFRRAWKSEAMRVRENIRLQELGLLNVAGAGGGTVVTGTKLVPVLAGKFSNTPSDPYSVASLQNQLFDGPNPTGTITGFYNEISHGNINLTGSVFGNGSGGLFQVSQPDTYYEGSPGCNGLNSTCGARTGEFLQEMLNGTDGTVDFGQYDNDGPDGLPNSGDDDGFVDFVAFVHPEVGGECGNNNLWSHRWVYEGWWGSPYTTNDAAFGGGFIQISDYTIQPLISCNGSSIIEIGVYAHEFGHAFGLPDLYDTNGGSEGIGNWGLMAGGSYGGDGNHPQTPSNMCAWSKEQLGWVQPTVVCNDSLGVALTGVITNGDVLKVYTNGIVGEEYFLLENRVQTGYDTWLPASGLAVWHIDNGQSGNQDETHKLVDLEEADGLNGLDNQTNRGDAGDVYPGSSNNFTFNDTSNPNSRDYDNNPTMFSVTNINGTADPRGFDMTVAPCVLRLSNSTVDDSPCGNNNGVFDGFERASLELCVTNDFDKPLNNVHGILTVLTAGVTVLQDSAFYGNALCGVELCGSNPFEIESTIALPAGGTVDFQLDLIGASYSSTINFSIPTGQFVLLVEDDGAANFDANFQNAITNAGFTFVHHDRDLSGIPSLGLLESALAVVWYTGEAFDNTLEAAEQTVVSQFLDNGGSLFITGQDIGYDLVSQGSPADQAFYANYLHATFISDDSGLNTLTGVGGDPIGNGLSMNLTSGTGANNSTFPSRISALPGASHVFQYAGGNFAAVRYDTVYLMFYMACNFESGSTTERDAVMASALAWLIPGDVQPPVCTTTFGGGTYSNCQGIPITWNASDNVGVTDVDLLYSTDGGVTYTPIVSGWPNTLAYNWDATGITGSGILVKIKARDAVGLQGVAISTGINIVDFDAVPPTVAVTAPNGGEDFTIPAKVVIGWTVVDSCSAVDSCQVWVSYDNGGAWNYLDTVVGADSLCWNTDSTTVSDSCLVRVDCWADNGTTMGSDASDAVWRLSQSTLGIDDSFIGATRPMLLNNHPNPFRSSTRFSFYLPEEANVSLRIYDLSGRLVRSLVNGPMASGTHQQSWDGRNDSGVRSSSGIYFFVMDTPAIRQVRKMVMTR